MNDSSATRENVIANRASAAIPDDLLATLESWDHPVVLGHVRPDADCLSSMFSMAMTWPGTGGRMAPVSLPAGSLSQRLKFLADWVDAVDATPDDFRRADGFVVVDTAKLARCNVDRTLGQDWLDGRPLINIDHHISNARFGTINWVDSNCGSAAELVHRLIRFAGRPIPALTASLLYAGIHSDTVGFSLPTTSASALQAAADLVKSGADVGEIGERLCRSQSRSEFALSRVIHDNTRIVADGRIAYSAVSYEELTGSGCSASDIDDQVTIPRCIQGIQVAVLLTEGKPGRIRLNLRGEQGIHVLGLATELGGGGHETAAGAIVDGAIDQVTDRVITMATTLLDNRGSHG